MTPTPRTVPGNVTSYIHLYGPEREPTKLTQEGEFIPDTGQFVTHPTDRGGRRTVLIPNAAILFDVRLESADPDAAKAAEEAAPEY